MIERETGGSADGNGRVNTFAFVIHPLDLCHIHNDPGWSWTRFLPDGLVERFAAYVPPVYLSKITGAVSPATGQRVEGHLISLGSTSREMMRRPAAFTYRGLFKAARMARRRGARVMGLGAFTSVVGDAGLTVARQAPIAVTSGNSLTVAATLEAARNAAKRMGIDDLTASSAMVVGATGSIGAVCARMIARSVRQISLVSLEPEKLYELATLIRHEAPLAEVRVTTRTDELIGDCDLVISATSAFGQRVLDIGRCKPGAVICDVARPPDISHEEARLRPDVLVVESGEVLIPGEVDIHYDIGLPPHVAYACLAETALLAMEGRFESFTLGRQLEVERVEEIQGLFDKHRFRLAPLRSGGRCLTDGDFAAKRALASDLGREPDRLERLRREVSARLVAMPARSKGVVSNGRRSF